MAREPVCPSTTGEHPHAKIIGFINRSGEVAPISPPITLTDEMRRSIGPQPERVFRLAGACLGDRCVQWANNECSLIGRMRSDIGSRVALADTPGALPLCGIRPDCVWWRQDGVDACRVCPHVVFNPSPVDDAGAT
jgi:hypothetical protein